MRIAYVINSLEGGGAASPVPAVCGLLRDRGAEVAVFALTRRDGRALTAIAKAAIEVRVRPGGEKDHLRALGWLARELAVWRPDLVWTSLTRATLLGQIVAESLRVPAVSWQHAAYLKPANRCLLRLRQRKSALWIADSECVAALTRDRLVVPPERLATWPLFAVDPLAPVATPWRPGGTLRIGSLGRLHPVKGYDVLLDALALLKQAAFRPAVPFEVLIAGEGQQRQVLEHRIVEHGLSNVHLVGFVERPREFLAGLHLYVQPSRSEGLCIAAHEAMQAGLPVIASEVGELPYTIEQRRTGLIVMPGNAEALSLALAELLAEPERLASLGMAALERVATKLSRTAFDERGAAILDRASDLVSGEEIVPHRGASRGRFDRPASRR